MSSPSLDQLRSLVVLSEPEQRAWLAVARVLNVPAKASLGTHDVPCTRLTFVNSGLLRVYFLAEASERTCRFLPEGSWYTDFESFATGGPSREYVQALEASEVVQIEKSDLEKLYREYPNLERAGRLLTESALVGIHQRNQMLTLESPELRYERLCEESPSLVNRLPQYYLASYLNIRPESLSRIRKRRRS
jgi:CRP-like cAMP-binding protein